MRAAPNNSKWLMFRWVFGMVERGRGCGSYSIKQKSGPHSQYASDSSRASRRSRLNVVVDRRELASCIRRGRPHTDSNLFREELSVKSFIVDFLISRCEVVVFVSATSSPS